MQVRHAAICGIAIGTIVFFVSTATAQLSGKRVEQGQQGDEPLELRAYPVGDILVAAPDYPYRGGELPTVDALQPPSAWTGHGGAFGGMGGGMGGMGGGMGEGMGGGGMGGGMFQMAPEGLASPPASSDAAGQASRQQQPRSADSGQPAGISTVRELIKAITSLVEPPSWAAVGGAGEITPFGTLLLVSQTPAVHQKIERFLDLIRAEGSTGQSVLVEAVWLLLDSSQLGKLTASTPQKAGASAVDPNVLEAMIREVPSYRGQVTCFNRQTVHMVAGNRRLVVIGAIPVVGSGIGYQPVVAFPNLGVLLQVTPSLLPGHDAVILDAHSTVTQWREPGKPLVIGGDYPPTTEGEAAGAGTVMTPVPGGRMTTEVDRLNILAQELDTSLRVPLGRPVLVGGLTQDPAAPAAGTQQPQGGKQLYLVVRVTLPDAARTPAAAKPGQR